MGLEHSRHRSPPNVLVRILSCPAACSLAQTKVNIGTAAISPDLIQDARKSGGFPLRDVVSPWENQS